MKTPTQQALIQFIKSIIITAIITAIVGISSSLTGSGSINWKQAGISFGLAVAFSLAHSVAAYLEAQPASSIDLVGLGAAIDALVGKVQNIQTVPATTITTAQSVHGPSSDGTPSTAQPATSGVQTLIPAFTATSEIPIVTAPATSTASA